MDEGLENTANEALRLIIDNAASAKDFILSELPDVVQQLLAYKAAECWFYILTPLACLLVSIMAIYIIFRIEPRSKDVREAVAEIFIPMLVAAGTVSLFLTAAALFINVPTLINIYVAPKVYLIEYASELIK